MWHSLKKSAKRFRSRSRDKLPKKTLDESRLTHSQPDISNSDCNSPGPSNDQDFDVLFGTSRKRHTHMEHLETERSFSDPSVHAPMINGHDRSRSEEKDSEIDSGITVVDHSVSTYILFFRYHSFIPCICGVKNIHML